MFATIDKFGRVKCAVVSYLLVAVFLIPVALEASGTFVWLGVEIKFRAPHAIDAMLSPMRRCPTYLTG